MVKKIAVQVRRTIKLAVILAFVRKYFVVYFPTTKNTFLFISGEFQPYYIYGTQYGWNNMVWYYYIIIIIPDMPTTAHNGHEN